MDVTRSTPHCVGSEQCVRTLLPTSDLLGCEDCRQVAITTMTALLRQDRSSPPSPWSVGPGSPEGRSSLAPAGGLGAWKVDVGYQARCSAVGNEVLHLSVLLPCPDSQRSGRLGRTATRPGLGGGPCNGCAIPCPSPADPDVVLSRALLPLPSNLRIGRPLHEPRGSELARLLGLLGDALLSCDLAGPLAHWAPAPGGATAVSLDPERLRAELRVLSEVVRGSPPGCRTPAMEGVQLWCGMARWEGPFPCLAGLSPRVDMLTADPILLVSLKRRPTELVSVALASSSAGLTTREALVARLLSERQSNLEIATILGISPHTARHHTEQVLVKLGLHSRSGVWARLYQTP